MGACGPKTGYSPHCRDAALLHVGAANEELTARQDDGGCDVFAGQAVVNYRGEGWRSA
jgi:hypothetical protein